MSVGNTKEEASEPTAVEPDASTQEEHSRTCIVCLCSYPSHELLTLRCSDDYCSNCLDKIFATALKDETMFPPSCCGISIKLKSAETHISNAVLKEYKAKWVELHTKNKTYCWKAACSAFIAPHSIHNGQAICQRCRARTCSKCKNAWHYGPCPEGEDTAFYEFLRKRKLKKCPQCRRMVEKNGGCNHIMWVTMKAGRLWY
jgi:hypothetical protein